MGPVRPLHQLVTALQDSLGRWVVTPEERTVQRATETGIHMSATVPDQTARAGTPVHAWRMLGWWTATALPPAAA